LSHGYEGIQFEDCGPLIQPRLAEACALAGLIHVSPEEDVTADVYRVPRWDRLLLHFEAPPPPQAVIEAYRTTIAPLLGLLRSAAEGGFAASCDVFPMDTIAVTRRAADHPFYHSDRMSGYPAYGSGRTALLNAEEVAERLRSEGLAAQVVDFGTMSLGAQILVARRARAILGIRGAEFANVVWMRPQTKAVLLSPPGRENHATRTLSRIMNVAFSRIPVHAAKVRLDAKGQAAATHLLLD
jgi:hypothetical protein